MDISERLVQIPTLTRITEDIYRLSVHFPFGMRQVNSYLFQGDKGFTVIDTGSQAKESIEIWEQAIAAGINVEKVVLTHSHPDHLGLAGWFQENYHVPVYISSLGNKEIQRIRNGDEGTWMNQLFKRHGGPEIPIELMSSEIEAYQFEPDGVFENRQKIKLGNDMYEIIWTPGHAPDQFCFYNHEQQIMVTGDHILGEISPIIAVWSDNDVNPLGEYFESLQLIKGYAVNLALAGHGKLIDDLKKRIDQITFGHSYRLEQILEAVRNEAKTAGQVFRETYGNLSIYKFFAPLMATITRLIYLESIGKVYSKEIEGVMYYHAT